MTTQLTHAQVLLRNKFAISPGSSHQLPWAQRLVHIPNTAVTFRETRVRSPLSQFVKTAGVNIQRPWTVTNSAKFSHLVEINVGLFVRVDAWDGWKEPPNDVWTGKNKATVLPANVLVLLSLSLSLFFFSFFFSFFLSFSFFSFLEGSHRCPTTSLTLVCYADSSSTDVKGLKAFAAGNNKLYLGFREFVPGHRAKLSRKVPLRFFVPRFLYASVPRFVRLMKDDSRLPAEPFRSMINAIKRWRIFAPGANFAGSFLSVFPFCFSEEVFQLSSGMSV